jgi:hypothetical protein
MQKLPQSIADMNNMPRIKAAIPGNNSVSPADPHFIGLGSKGVFGMAFPIVRSGRAGYGDIGKSIGFKVQIPQEHNKQKHAQI